jgi:hypothetical protein
LVGVSAVAQQHGALALFAGHRRGLLRYQVGDPPPDARVVLRGDALAASSGALAAIGIDGEGFLLYAEAGPGGQAALLSAIRAAGVAQALALPQDVRLAFVSAGHAVAVDGKRELSGEKSLVFMAETRPPAQVIFGDVKPMPYNRWGWLQGQRVRYFPSGPPRFPTPAEVLAPGQTRPEAPR